MTLACDWFGDGSVYVVDLPLACCALESQTALAGKDTIEAACVPASATLVVTLSGTISTPLVPAIKAQLEDLGRPVTVVAFGACTCAGGPYWDSYAVARGAGELGHVDHFIAGCPPPPGALAEFLDALASRVEVSA